MTKKMSRVLVALFAVVGSTIVFLCAFLYFPRVTSDQIFYLPAGASRQSVMTALQQQKLVRQHWVLNTYAVLSGRDVPKTGEYLFAKGSTPLSIWRQLTAGTGFFNRPFIIIPGWTFKQLREALSENPWLKHTIDKLNDNQIMALLQHPNASPEGLFYPETYFFTRDETDQHILQQAYQLMESKLNQAYAERAETVPYRNASEALIVASLIEKEGRVDSERPVIASVIINRLQHDMLLQIDATVIYALGSNYTGMIYKNDLKIDSVYNTYRYKGLPPAPIAIPGLPSILAALHPAKTPYYFYVAKPDGSHQFSTNLDDHHKAVQTIRTLQQQQQQTSYRALQRYLEPLLGLQPYPFVLLQ